MSLTTARLPRDRVWIEYMNSIIGEDEMAWFKIGVEILKKTCYRNCCNNQGGIFL